MWNIALPLFHGTEIRQNLYLHIDSFSLWVTKSRWDINWYWEWENCSRYHAMFLPVISFFSVQVWGNRCCLVWFLSLPCTGILDALGPTNTAEPSPDIMLNERVFNNTLHQWCAGFFKNPRTLLMLYIPLLTFQQKKWQEMINSLLIFWKLSRIIF